MKVSQCTEVPIPYSERVGRSKLSVVRDGSIFLRSMLWTVLAYNPVRIFGIIGLIGVVLASLVIHWITHHTLKRSYSNWTLGVAALFTAMVLSVTGISIFALGATFNYLVTLFYKRPIRQGLFGKPIFTTPLEQHFGWLGLLGLLGGSLLALTSMILGINGWDIARLWLYLLGSAMLTLVSVQLIIYWILMRVLEELSQREDLVAKDLSADLDYFGRIS